MWPVIDRLARDYGWNRRVWTQDDFDYLCGVEGIRIEYRDIDFPGCYSLTASGPLITIRPSVLPRALLWVEIHELAHFYLHAPGCAFMYSEDKLERQADLIAACALIPRPLLDRMSLYEIRDEYRYPAELCDLRQRFLVESGI